MLLDGRVVIVTGVGPGLGLSISRACAREGARVVLAARSQERLDAFAEDLQAETGAEVLAVAADVTDDARCAHLVERAVEGFGRLDGLVNSAFQQPPFESVDELSMDTWLRSFDINCHTAIRMTKAALPALRAAAPSSVVNITTMSIHLNRVRFGAYAAAKSALWSATRTLANEVGPDGVRVNAVAPGYIWGDPVRWYLQHQADQRGVPYDVVEDELKDQIALRVIPHPDDIANSVVFFLSDLSKVVTGTMLDVNGGQIMR